MHQARTVIIATGANERTNRVPGEAELLGRGVSEEEVRAIRLGPSAGEEFELPVSAVFVYLQGGQPGTSFLSGELDRGEGGCILVDRTKMQTMIPGVYAVGDVTCARLKQAIISAAEGAVAAISADKFIHRVEKTSPGRYW